MLVCSERRRPKEFLSNIAENTNLRQANVRTSQNNGRATQRMRYLLRAARGEYAKLEKTLTEAEVSGWA